MKRGTRNAFIILLIIAIAFAVGGFAGLNNAKEARAKAASLYANFETAYKNLENEAETYIAQAADAVADIKGYSAELESWNDLMMKLGAGAGALDSFVSDGAALAAQAEEDYAGMQEQLKKMQDIAASVTEDSSDEDIKAADSKTGKYRNAIQRSLKKITKIEAAESTQSYETQIAKLADKAKAQILEAYPDADLGDEYVPHEFVPEDAGGAEEEGGATFADFLGKSYQYLLWLAGVILLAAVLSLIGWIKPPTLKRIGAVANKNMMLVALITITLIFFVATNYTILTPTNVSNIINQNAYIIILACGMLLCIVCSGNIDLSVGRVMGFIGAVAAKLMIEAKMPTVPGILICLVVGVLIGMWQGFWIAYVHIPAFIVTLAGQLLFYGLSMLILKGLTISNFPQAFQNVFCSFIADPFGGSLFGIKMNVLAMLVGIIGAAIVVFLQIHSRNQRRRKGYTLEPIGSMIARTVVVAGVILWLFYSLARAKGIPSVLITVGIVLLIYAYVTSKTVIGRHLYAMGGNVNAARLSGVKTQKMLFLAYVNMGLLAALAGLVYAARLNASSPQAGDGDELYAIASCYIGGASAYGGIGTVGGALIGALTMGVIKNGMSIMGLGQAIQQMVLGMVLLAAVVIDVVSKQKISLPFSFHAGKHKAKS